MVFNCRECHSNFEADIHAVYCENCDSRDIEAQGPFYANVYLTDRAYGGPEEGGWWYSVGEPIESIRHDFQEEAEETAKQLRVKYPNTGRRPISSVLSDGEYRVRIEDHFAAPWPDSKPMYE